MHCVAKDAARGRLGREPDRLPERFGGGSAESPGRGFGRQLSGRLGGGPGRLRS